MTPSPLTSPPPAPSSPTAKPTRPPPPARAPVCDARPASRRLDDERKRIHDAVRMATYNAESALARLLAAHYPRADDEARTLLREIFTAPADVHISGNKPQVRFHPLSAPRRTRALAGLCADLTATQPPTPAPTSPSSTPSKTTELCNHSRTYVRSPGLVHKLVLELA
jgi:hypothetical protein